MPRNTGSPHRALVVMGVPGSWGPRICKLKGNDEPEPRPQGLQTGGRLALGGGREGMLSIPGAGALSVLTWPVFLLVRGVKKEDKSLAVGIQFMLLRVLGKEPAWDHWSRCPLCASLGGTGMQSLTLGFTGPRGNRSSPGTLEEGGQAARQPIWEVASDT